jgi:hypothetical protein
MKIDLKTKKIEIDISKVNLKRIRLNDMTPKEALSYIMSLQGEKSNIRLDLRKYRIESPENSDPVNERINSRRKNEILERYRSFCSINHDHKPIGSLKYFGVEIECIVPLESLDIDSSDYSRDSSEEIECGTCEGSGEITYRHRDSGSELEGTCPSCDGSGMVENEDYDDSSTDSEGIYQEVKRKLNKKIQERGIKGINIKTDGSIDFEESEEIGLEFTVLMPQDNFSSLEKLCALLSELDTKVNKSCGLHVHIDSRDLKSKKSVQDRGNLYLSALPFLKLMVPKSRLSNTYCKLSMSTVSGDRYHAINLAAFEKFNTIEIRLHSATTDFKKISAWLSILKKIGNLKGPLSSGITLSQFVESIGADPQLKEYIFERVNQFKGKENKIEESDLNETESELSA